jgi:HD-like signal output (HDOD) protein
LNLVLEMATQRNAMLADPRLAKQAQQIAAYAQGTASMAEWLAQRLKLDAELCYTAGLLHNIGELALLRSLQDWLDSGGEVPDEAIEPLLRARSAGFGSALRAQWRLPLALRQAIAGFYALGAGVHSREALVLNLSRLLLELPASSSVASLAEARTVRLLRIDPQLLGAAPRG